MCACCWVQDEVSAIISLVGRLGMQPTPEWLEIITAAAMDKIGQRDTLRVAEYRRLLVGLATLGWRPNQQQLQMVADKSYPLLRMAQAHDLVEIAWSLAQWETPMPQQWTQVCDLWHCGVERVVVKARQLCGCQA